MPDLQWSAIPTKEVHNTRREWFDKHGNFNAQVTLEVASDLRFKLVQDLYTCCYGNSYSENGGYLPRAYPDETIDIDPGDFPAPKMNKIGVMSVSLSDIPANYTTDAAAEVIHSNYVYHVQVQYGAFWNIQEGIEFETKVTMMSNQDFKWKTPLNEKDQGFIKSLEVPVMREETAILTREFIGLSGCKGYQSLGDLSVRPDIRTFFGGIVGRTNAYAYTSVQVGKTFPPGSLLLMKPIIRPAMDMQNIGVLPGGASFNNFGGPGFSVQVAFLFKYVPLGPNQLNLGPHNTFWRARALSHDGLPPFGLPGDKYGSWDTLVVKWETDSSPNKNFVPFKMDSEVDENWLIPPQLPRPAPL